MSLLDFPWKIFKIILEFNFLLSLIVLLLWGILLLKKLGRSVIPYRTILKTFYYLLPLSFAITISPFPNTENSTYSYSHNNQVDSFISPLTQFYSEITSGLEKRVATTIVHLDPTSLAKKIIVMIDQQKEVFKNNLSFFFILLTMLGLVFYFYRFFKTRRVIQHLIQSSFLIKAFKQSGLRLLISENIKGPFSIFIMGKKWIFIPSYLLSEKKLYFLSLKHEIQHHRQKDTFMVYGIEFLKHLFFYNPFSWLLSDQMNKLQEFACDESVTSQEKNSQEEYSLGLLKIAEYQMTSQMAPHMTSQWNNLTFKPLIGITQLSTSASFLKRRILAMKNYKTCSRLKTLFFGLVIFPSFMGISFAGKNLFQKSQPSQLHAISMEKAEVLVAKANLTSTIPIFVNKEVLHWLNLGVNTERGRMYLKASLRRMKRYEKMINGHILAAYLPQELMAVPLSESGFQNYDNGVGAGIWSFIPETARRFGLVVNDETDERFDEGKLTEASMKYFTALIGINEFKENWHLALIAYNSGEKRLREAIAEVGSTDALEVIRKTTLLKKENLIYLPRLMAYLIVLKNPDLLE